MLSGLNKLPKSKITVYRGLRTAVPDLEPHDAWIEGSQVTLWAFTSTTSNHKSICDFLGKSGSRTMINLHCHNAVNISAFSELQNKSEYLIVPGTEFKVEGVIKLAADLWHVWLEESGQGFAANFQ
eukprot:TRINITY_DN3817_c1_g1_i1.p1 TRINITY_DN3817_c1_g1~~TRINITY_DN3817_c1_g1_i1.p1  ORF type:complete len:126 (-),score=17.34 TRINITY_DN3817_c1_g1_i1:87-464(-)